jgi:hypothetical protein
MVGVNSISVSILDFQGSEKFAAGVRPLPPLVMSITAAAKGHCNIQVATLEATMTATLRQTSNFLQRFAKRFHEARQAKAQRIITEHLRHYRKCQALGSVSQG